MGESVRLSLAETQQSGIPAQNTGNSARVARYRASHRRIDYAPGPDALAAIERRLSDNPEGYSVCGVIDDLIMAGDGRQG